MRLGIVNVRKLVSEKSIFLREKKTEEKQGLEDGFWSIELEKLRGRRDGGDSWVSVQNRGSLEKKKV